MAHNARPTHGTYVHSPWPLNPSSNHPKNVFARLTHRLHAQTLKPLLRLPKMFVCRYLDLLRGEGGVSEAIWAELRALAEM